MTRTNDSEKKTPAADRTSPPAASISQEDTHMNGIGSAVAVGGLVLLIIGGSSWLGAPPEHHEPAIVDLQVGTGRDVTVLRSQGFHGQCPVCESKRQVSVVYKGWCTSTLLATEAWYDTAGNYHFRDPNHTTCEHRCSAEHRFQVIFAGTEELILRPDGSPVRF